MGRTQVRRTGERFGSTPTLTTEADMDMEDMGMMGGRQTRVSSRRPLRRLERTLFTCGIRDNRNLLQQHEHPTC